MFGSTSTSVAGVASIAATMSAVDGFIVWPPSITRRRAVALEETAVAVAGRRPRRRRSRASVRVGHRLEEPLLALLRLLVHVRDLDALDRPDRGAERERAPGLVGVDVHLERGRVADDEQRVAEPLELALERVGVEPLALDHEHRAVAVLRQLLVDGVEARLVRVLGRRLRDRLAGERGGDAADDLEQPGAARVDDAGLLRTASWSGVRASASSPRATSSFCSSSAGSRRRVARDPRPPPPARGSPSASSPRPAAGRRGRRRRSRRGTRGAIVGRVERPASPSTSAAPRTIWLEDHARVAARAHQRRARELLRERRAVGRRSTPRAPRRSRARSASGSCRCRRPGRDRR